MGIISSLQDRIRQRLKPRLPIVVGQFGFSVGDVVVVWQLVSEIRARKVDRITTDEALLEFHVADQIIVVSEEQQGFPALEAAMCAVFPTTTTWRSAVLLPPFAPNLTLVFRRGHD